MSWQREALALWQTERKDLYSAGYLPQDMRRAQEAIERLNKEIEREDNRKEMASHNGR